MTFSDCISIPDDFKLEAIATDMDGTFFGPRLSIAESTLSAYRRAVQLGIPILPATGRVKEGVEGALKSAGADDVKLFPGVYLNGCTTYGTNGDLIWESHVPEKVIKLMVDFERRINERAMSYPNWEENPLIKDAVPEHGFKAVLNRDLKPAFVALMGYSRGRIVWTEDNWLTDGVKQFQEGCGEKVGSLVDYARVHPIHKLLLVSHCGKLMEPLRDELTDLLGGEVVMSAGVPRILELTPKGVTKAEALLRLTKSLGLSLESVACLGDGENDIQMLEEGGFSVAMGNALASLKVVAHTVTKSNAENGWALAVNALLDKKEKDMNQVRLNGEMRK